jgi:hypothetical protein
MITPKEYNQFAGTIANSFGKEWNRVQDQFDTAYQFLKYIPNSAWLPLSQLVVNQWEKWPQNIVKAIQEVYGNWGRNAGSTGELNISYDKDDDARFPINLMHRAFNILDSQGFDKYLEYANIVHIPKTDRDRIENKHRICSNHEQSKFKLPEIGQRTNRKQPRDEIAKLRETFPDEVPL